MKREEAWKKIQKNERKSKFSNSWQNQHKFLKDETFQKETKNI